MIRCYSDLHLEFDEFDGVNKLAFDAIIPIMKNDYNTILILAGDIGVGCEHMPFVQYMCSRFKHVIYIFGNHEYYKQEMQELHKDWKQFAEKLPNLHVLINEHVVIDDVAYYGGTMWTDFGKDWFVKQHCTHDISDFYLIRNHGKRFNGEMAEQLLADFKTGLVKTVHDHDYREIVVISHMCCTEKHIHEKYKGNPLNPYFCTEMSNYFNDKIKLWVHGHVHNHFDTRFDATRVYCNPRGYPTEYNNVKHDLIKI